VSTLFTGAEGSQNTFDFWGELSGAYVRGLHLNGRCTTVQGFGAPHNTTPFSMFWCRIVGICILSGASCGVSSILVLVFGCCFWYPFQGMHPIQAIWAWHSGETLLTTMLPHFEHPLCGLKAFCPLNHCLHFWLLVRWPDWQPIDSCCLNMEIHT